MKNNHITGSILIVEDNIDNLQLLSTLLTKSGHIIQAVKSGQEALDAVRDSIPEIILLDVNLPDISGYEVCRRIKENALSRDLPILFLSALHDTDSKLQGFEVGGVDYITKPFHFTEVLARIQTHLELSQMRSLLNQKNKEILLNNLDLKEKNEEILTQNMMLDDLNKNLIVRVNEEVAKNREKDQMMIVQSRQAAMGEMIANIAHQWRQPLNNINLLIMDLFETFKTGSLDNSYFSESMDSFNRLVKHMSHTIDDFRNFYKPDKFKSDFKIIEVIEKVLSFVEREFKHKGILIEIIGDKDINVNGLPNEYAQVLLNIINNAKEAIIESNIKNPLIKIELLNENDKAIVLISNNAGKIPDNILNNIFDPFFTTKGDKNGTGIGLYMSKSIIEKNMKGMLSARNIEEGAEFRIEINI